MRTVELGVLMLLGLLPTHAMHGNRGRFAGMMKDDGGGRGAAFAPPLTAASLLRRASVGRCSQTSPGAAPASPVAALRGQPLPRSLGSRPLTCMAGSGRKGAATEADVMAANKVADARPKVLITGGAGYIGTHLAVDLLQSGVDVVVFDNFQNSSPLSIDRVVSHHTFFLSFFFLPIRTSSPGGPPRPLPPPLPPNRTAAVALSLPHHRPVRRVPHVTIGGRGVG